MWIHQHHAWDPNSHRIHGEVPPDQIVVEVVPKLDSGFSGLTVIAVGTVGRYFNSVLTKSGRDRAESSPHIPGGISQWGDQSLDLVGGCRGGEVEVVHLLTEKRVSHRTADEGQLETRLVKGVSEGAHRRGRDQILQSVEGLGNACHRAQSLDSERASRTE
ncbi:MAG: Uncharacterised protein [Cellulomonadaceae bacterium TMED98]|nr:MAG: Uncharacterised protein [Cellulomonadaceae bacterium TMED98]